MSLNIVTMVWGKMVDWYLDWHIPSLLQSGNLPALKDANYILYTDEVERLSAVLTNAITRVKTQVLPLVSGRGRVNDCVKHCAARVQGHLAVFPAEFVFGDCSLRNLEAACEKFDLVVYGFPRCRLTAMAEIVPFFQQKKRLSNAELVSIAIEHLHRETRSPYVVIRRTADYKWKVQHLTPNLIVKINEKSLSFINSIPANNGLLDHCVPLQCVEAGMSYHYIGESDEVFLIEPTKRRLASCRTESYPKREEWDALAHRNMDFWKKFTATWKGDPSAGSRQAWRRGYLGRLYNRFASLTD